MNEKTSTFELHKKSFSTLKAHPETGKFYVSLEFDSYYDLLTTAKNQITNAQEVIYSIGNESTSNSNLFAVYELLNIVSQMLPINEMEFLDEIIKE
jgi:hypothetical protein